MVYLDPEAVEDVVSYMSNTFEENIFMDYEMFNPTSNFGKMMVQNFKNRGVPLVSISNFMTLPKIEQMYTDAGYAECRAVDMQRIFMEYIPMQEHQRIRKLEWLDELEEIALIQSHYFVSIARKRKKGLEDSDDETQWMDEIGFECLSK